MRRMNMVVVVLALLFTVSGVANAQAGPTAYLQSIDKKLKPLLENAKANEKKIVKVVNQLLDFKTLCKDSLGKHWEGKTDAQRKEFSDTLHALIEKNVVARLKDTKNHIIKYESEEVNGKKASVVTIVADGTGPRAIQTEITYKMRKQGARWLVVNMVTDGVSLISNYRSQFNKIITKDGWDVMMKKMHDKLAE